MAGFHCTCIYMIDVVLYIGRVHVMCIYRLKLLLVYIPFSLSSALCYRRLLLLDPASVDWPGVDQTSHAHTSWNSNVKEGYM